jgi:hypothetical protein
VSIRMRGQIMGAPPTTATRRSVIFKLEGMNGAPVSAVVILIILYLSSEARQPL